jgi:hypothetical protein
MSAVHTLPALTPQERRDIAQGNTSLPRLRQHLSDQHPVLEEIAKTYDNLGGTVGLTNWAEKNPTDFYKMFAATAPKPQQVEHTGGLEIRLSLQRNPYLDGEAPEDAEYDDVPI